MTASEPRPLDRRRRWSVRAGLVLLRLLGATWRVRVVKPPVLMARPEGAPGVVLVLWHGQMLPILWVHTTPTSVLVSEHKDGEVIARVLQRFGFASIRGSTSRGGTRALLEAARELRSGRDIAVTPDGPRGPRHTFAPGALILAYRAGAPIVPLTAHVDRAWTLRSWDAFVLPKPFARVTVRYGDPVLVEAADVRAAADRTDEFAAVMQDAVARTAALAAEGAR